MSLDYDLSNIPDSTRIVKNPDGTERMNPVTETLIWATIAVDLGSITEKNAKDFYHRLRAWEMVSGAFLEGRSDKPYITFAEVKAHIGLKCNVTDRTDNQFAAKLFKVMSEEADRVAKKEE